MTPTTDDVAGLVERLLITDYFSDDVMAVRTDADQELIDRLRAERKAAACILESQAKALREAEALAFQLNSGKELQDLMALNNELLARALAAEAERDGYVRLYNDEVVERLKAEARLKEAEKVIEPFAAQFALIECTAFHGIDDNGTWPVDEDQVVQISHLRAARAFLNAGEK